MSICILPLRTLAATEGLGYCFPHSPCAGCSLASERSLGAYFTPRLQTGAETPVILQPLRGAASGTCGL